VLYWARLEAYYRDIPDLLDVPARKLLNLVLHWMMEHTDGEVWAEKFRPIFFPTDDENPQRQQAAKAKLAPAVAGQQGSLNITPKAEPVKVTDLSQFLGRAGSTGKVDPNKATLAAKARAKSAIKIAPDENGDLSIDTP
jgi:hypothetical protein